MNQRVKKNITLNISDRIFKHNLISKGVRRDMQNREEKFLVINIKKRKQDMYDACKTKQNRLYVESLIANLEEAVVDFASCYERITGKKLNQKYIVCNQDEPYAEDIWKIILNKKKQEERDE